MTQFHCNCCGCDFSEAEGREYADIVGADAEIVYPVCGACYDEENETIIESYKE